MTEVFQPKIQFLFEPDAQLDDNIIVIGNPETETNLNLLPEFLKEFEACKLFAFDIETFASSKESWQALWWYKNHIRLMQIGVESGLVLIIDLGGWKEYPLRQSILENEGIRGILDILGDKLFDHSVAVLGANLKFDGTTVREKFGFKLRQARDIMIMSQVLWAGLGVLKAGKGENRSERCKLGHGLKAIAERFDFEVDKSQQVSAWGWQMSNSQLNYAANDVRTLFPLYYWLKRLLTEAGCLYSAWVECNGVSVFIDMEFNGVPISEDKCKEIINRLEEEHAGYVAEFNKHFPGVSHSSNVQVLQALKVIYPELESVAKGVLYTLEHPSAKALINKRAIKTDIDYVHNVLNNSFRGKIRAQYRQIAASGNGRSSCAQFIYVNRKKHLIGAQLQNPSKKIRDIFEAPPGYVFFDFDGAQMHARIAAQASLAALLIKIFGEDYDGHSILAGKIAELCEAYWRSLDSEEYPEVKDLLSVKWNQDLVFAIKSKEEWTKKLSKQICSTAIDFRNVAKTALYSMLNGATAGRLLLAMHDAGYEWFTIEQAKETLAYFYQVYPELKKYIDTAIATASASNYDFSKFKDLDGVSLGNNWGRTQTLTGRLLYLKKYPNRFKPNKLEVSMTDCTAAQWTPVEKDLMIHWAFECLYEADAHPEWDFSMCNLPHDQGTFLAKEEYAKEIAPLIVNKFDEVCKKWITAVPMVEQSDLINPMSCVKKVLTK